MTTQTQGRNQGGNAQPATRVGLKLASRKQQDYLVSVDRGACEAMVAYINSNVTDPQVLEECLKDMRAKWRDAPVLAAATLASDVSKQLQAHKDLRAWAWANTAKPVPAAPVVEVPAAEERKLVEPGFFLFKENIFKVIATKDGQRVYAKQLVIDTVANKITWATSKGTVFNLTEDHRLTAEQAIEFSQLHERCAICGKHIENTTSVERGIGPKCWKNAGF